MAARPRGMRVLRRGVLGLEREGVLALLVLPLETPTDEEEEGWLFLKWKRREVGFLNTSFLPPTTRLLRLSN